MTVHTRAVFVRQSQEMGSDIDKTCLGGRLKLARNEGVTVEGWSRGGGVAEHRCGDSLLGKRKWALKKIFAEGTS